MIATPHLRDHDRGRGGAGFPAGCGRSPRCGSAAGWSLTGPMCPRAASSAPPTTRRRCRRPLQTGCRCSSFWSCAPWPPSLVRRATVFPCASRSKAACKALSGSRTARGAGEPWLDNEPACVYGGLRREPTPKGADEYDGSCCGDMCSLVPPAGNAGERSEGDAHGRHAVRVQAGRQL